MPSRQRGSFYLKQAVRCTVLLRLYWVVKALHFLARCTVHWSGTNRPLSDHNWYMRLQEAQEQHCVSFFPTEWNRGLIGFIWHPVLTQYVCCRQSQFISPAMKHIYMLTGCIPAWKSDGASPRSDWWLYANQLKSNVMCQHLGLLVLLSEKLTLLKLCLSVFFLYFMF